MTQEKPIAQLKRTDDYPPDIKSAISTLTLVMHEQYLSDVRSEPDFEAQSKAADKWLNSHINAILNIIRPFASEKGALEEIAGQVMNMLRLGIQEIYERQQGERKD